MLCMTKMKECYVFLRFESEGKGEVKKASNMAVNYRVDILNLSQKYSLRQK